MTELTTISVTRETRDALAKLGIYGDTFDSIIARLLNSMGNCADGSGGQE